MQNAALFVAPVYFIEVDSGLGRGDRLDDVLWLTNDPERIRKLFSARMTGHIGTLERGAVCEAGLVAYGRFEGEHCPLEPSLAEQSIAMQLVKLHHFVLMLWLVKDNASHIENGFLEWPDGISSRMLPMLCTLADGTSSPMSFTREELRDARDLYRSLFSSMTSWGAEEFESKVGQEVAGPTSSPLRRAFFFIGAARASKNLSVKIANYCSALEALLIPATSTELTYRLATRVAWLLGESVDERRECFRRVKTAYSIRSTAIHGGALSARKMRNDLESAVKWCDEIVRAIIGVVVNDAQLRDYIVGKAKDESGFEERLQAITLGDTESEASV